jgi:hypothetical protein
MRLRISMATTLLSADEADAALAQLDAALHALNGQPNAITELAERVGRATVQLYRANADGCRAAHYLLEEFFSTPLATVPVWRGLVLLLRARLMLIARGASGGVRDLLARAASAIDDVEQLALPCFEDDVRLVRASIAAARAQRTEALSAIAAVIADKQQTSLAGLIAMRARGQLLGDGEGRRLTANAEELLAQRGVVNARRFARLFVPGIEELAAHRPTPA